jgi:amino acid transporter
MLISHQERPRELKWYHAGPMLYGDWGTSRFYVLGLAFYYALFSSFWYVLGVGVLVAAVGWAYTVVCRAYPDGGGVYSAARQLSKVLSVIGALLLFADYAVTASLSALDGIYYMGVDSAFVAKILAIGAILLLGAINYIGPKWAGTFALIVAMGTLVLTLILVAFSIPHLSAGWHAIRPMEGTLEHKWSTLVAVVLALSGVEAIANMTGVMVQPVARTAKKSIWPVLIEVVAFNVILAVAMLGLPSQLQQTGRAHPGEFKEPAVNYAGNDNIIDAYRANHPNYQADAEYHTLLNLHQPHSGPLEEAMKIRVMRVMAEQYVHPYFGVVCGVVFGLLLLSAVNTVIGGMISVCYVMSRDLELPRFFASLNMFGVPWAALVPALGVPCLLLLIFPSVEDLADLYAMGVVGAIGINLSCCTINKKLEVKIYERFFIGVIAVAMIAIESTLVIQKPHAVIFVLAILVVGLGARYVNQTLLPARARAKVRRDEEQALALPKTEEILTALGTPADQLDMSLPHVMVAARGGQRLLDFAAGYAHQLNGILFVLFVRQINVQFAIDSDGPTLEEDYEAKSVFLAASKECKKYNVPMVPIYVVSHDVSYSILDFAATYCVRALLMGVSREGAVLRALRGDVLTAVADGLPQDIPLLIHA